MDLELFYPFVRKIERKLKFDHFFGQNSKIRKIDRRNRKVSRTVV